MAATALSPRDVPVDAEAPQHALVQRLMRLFRVAVPTARGVLLATPDGTPVVHDLPYGFDPVAAAEAGVHARRRMMADAGEKGSAVDPASAFVDTVHGPALVVFVDPDFALYAGYAPVLEAAVVASWAGTDTDGGGREGMEA